MWNDSYVDTDLTLEDLDPEVDPVIVVRQALSRSAGT
jgi:hypothetical protein